MARIQLKGFVAALLVLAAGFIVSSGRSNGFVAVAAFVSVLALLAVVNRMAGGYVQEVTISGIILGLVEAYHFLIQPNVEGLPHLGGSGALFFGLVIAFRAVLFVIEVTKNPLKPYLTKVVGR